MNKNLSKIHGLSSAHSEPATSLDMSYKPKRKSGSLLFLGMTGLVAALFLFAGWEHLVPAASVSTVAAIAVKADVRHVRQGQIAFQAAGWVEPAPTEIKVSTLVDGIIREVHFIEGDQVKEGDVLAQLIDEDLILDLREAEAELGIMESAVAIATAEMMTAAANLVHQDRRIKTASAELAKLENERAILSKAGAAISKIQREQIVHACHIQEAILEDTEAKKILLGSELAVKKAMIANAEMKLRQQSVRIERAKLNLSRIKIHSPVDGIIMRLRAVVGSKHNVTSDNPDSAVIAELYRPEMLQVRVDVPLADAGALSVGQEAIIEFDILPGEKNNGSVTSIVGMADIQRNTLQAKVEIRDPSLKLRPEMLAKVKFQTMAKAPTEDDSGERVRIFIPKRAIQFIDASSGSVWILNPGNNRLSRKSIAIGQAEKEDWIEIKTGINPGQMVVTSDTAGLKEGARAKTQNSVEH